MKDQNDLKILTEFSGNLDLFKQENLEDIRLRSKKLYLRNALIVAAAAMVVGISSTMAAAQPKPPVASVKVVNTAAEPIPVTVAPGTMVGISGTPTVALASDSSVKVTSTAENPLFVSSISSREPFQVSFFDGANEGENFFSVNPLTVPAGKRAVIEFITLKVFVGPGQFVRSIQFAASFKGDVSIHRFVGQPIAADPRNIILATPAKIHVDPGTFVALSLVRFGGASELGELHGTLTGYFENVPALPQ